MSIIKSVIHQVCFLMQYQLKETELSLYRILLLVAEFAFRSGLRVNFRLYELGQDAVVV